MGPAAILALIQAVSSLAPEVIAIIPSVKSVLDGTGSEADLANIQAVTAALNRTVIAAEDAAGATGPEA